MKQQGEKPFTEALPSSKSVSKRSHQEANKAFSALKKKKGSCDTTEVQGWKDSAPALSNQDLDSNVQKEMTMVIIKSFMGEKTSFPHLWTKSKSTSRQRCISMIVKYMTVHHQTLNNVQWSKLLQKSKESVGLALAQGDLFKKCPKWLFHDPPRTFNVTEL